MFRILVVDDNWSDVRLLEILLKSASRPHRLDWAKDGLEALELLASHKSNPGSALPNLILMDLNMPRVDGLRALQAIKSDPELSLIPVIILSSSALDPDVRNSYRAHANCFVQKPTSVERSEGLVRAIEAFWMDFAVFASPDGTSRAPDGKHVFPVAFAAGEASHPILTEESLLNATALRSGVPCEEHRRLMENFAAGVKELLELHRQQFEAAVHAGPECYRFDLLIHRANERNHQAKYAYLQHVEEHGCSNLDVIAAVEN